jgi:hypothetical protein
MKKNNLLAILALAASPAFLQAQTTSYSDIVGYQTISVPTGLSTAGFPLLNADLVKTAVTSLSGNSIQLGGQSNVGSLLSATEPYYVEVYSGALKGDRFDVDTAATISAANGSVVINPSSLNNTYVAASIANQLDGATVALRKHITLEQVQQMASAPMVGSNTASAADQIQFYDNATQGYASFFLRADGVTWRKVGTTAVANKTPIPAGAGVFISKQGSQVTLTSSGIVRANDFANPLKAGLQLQAPAFPLDVTPASLGGTVANGWTGNNTAASADQIQVYNPSTAGYDAYFLRSDGTTWRKVGTTTAVTSNTVATSGQAFFVSRQAADNNSVLINPIAQ